MDYSYNLQPLLEAFANDNEVLVHLFIYCSILTSVQEGYVVILHSACIASRYKVLVSWPMPTQRSCSMKLGLYNINSCLENLFNSRVEDFSSTALISQGLTVQRPSQGTFCSFLNTLIGRGPNKKIVHVGIFIHGSDKIYKQENLFSRKWLPDVIYFFFQRDCVV